MAFSARRTASAPIVDPTGIGRDRRGERGDEFRQVARRVRARAEGGAQLGRQQLGRQMHAEFRQRARCAVGLQPLGERRKRLAKQHGDAFEGPGISRHAVRPVWRRRPVGFARPEPCMGSEADRSEWRGGEGD